MIQWKQRLYAFLLRRILGPFLDDESSKILHDSIDFSLQEGRFVLKDVSLNSEFLTEKVGYLAPRFEPPPLKEKPLRDRRFTRSLSDTARRGAPVLPPFVRTVS